MTALAVAAVAPSPSSSRATLLVALAMAFAALALPDCCLNGRHATGFGMELYGQICQAAR